MQALWERHLCRQQRKRFAKGRHAGVLSKVVSTAGLCDEEEDKYIYYLRMCTYTRSCWREAYVLSSWYWEAAIESSLHLLISKYSSACWRPVASLSHARPGTRHGAKGTPAGPTGQDSAKCEPQRCISWLLRWDIRLVPLFSAQSLSGKYRQTTKLPAEVLWHI